MADTSTPLSKYITTRPILPPSSSRLPIQATIPARTNPILSSQPTSTQPLPIPTQIQLRPLHPSDLPHIYALRSQRAVMINTSTGRVDADLAASQTWMNRFLPPNDATTYDLCIWARISSDSASSPDSDWEHIGVIGSHILTPVAHIGYMLRTEWWGRGIATAALRAFMTTWWDLPRQRVTIDPAELQDEHERYLVRIEASRAGNVDAETGLVLVPEILFGEIEENNVGSRRVIEKCGFEYVGKETVAEDNGTVVLWDYVARRSGTV